MNACYISSSTHCSPDHSNQRHVEAKIVNMVAAGGGKRCPQTKMVPAKNPGKIPCHDGEKSEISEIRKSNTDLLRISPLGIKTDSK
jgi:hypothetical protein